MAADDCSKCESQVHYAGLCRKCFYRKHNQKNKAYARWTAMIRRCHDPRSKDHKNYGARGVTVCDRWRFGEDGKSGYHCFMEDMGQLPEGMSIDRKDNDKGYEPSNCKWSSRKEQNRNKRRTRRYEYEGRMLTIGELSELTGTNRETIKTRLRRGWDVARAVS